jgi:putative ABC transport system permease protein
MIAALLRLAPVTRIALRELRSNIMRSGLTSLGIIIGVAAVITIVSLGSGATLRITSDISSLGRNLLLIMPGSNRQGGGMYMPAEPFKMQDVLAIEREIRGIGGVAPAANQSAVAVFGNQNWSTQVAGTDNAYLSVREWALDSGRAFTDSEERSGRAVCVIGQTVRAKLFGQQNPVGAELRIKKVPCLVIGTLEAKGKSTFGQDPDDIVVMPLRTVQRRIVGNQDINVVYVSVEEASETDRVKSDIERLMRERRKLSRTGEDNFQVNDMKEIARVVESATGVMTALLSAVAAVSLVVGGIGIMNIMLVSVTERTREIGIRLAIGALEGDVLMQFLIEAGLLAAFGGLIGVVLGLVCSYAASLALGIPFVVDVPMGVIAVAFSAVVGIAFGYFPARRAARLDPIEALRYE